MELENKEIVQGTDKQKEEPNTATAVIYHVEKAARQWVIFAAVAFTTVLIGMGALLAHQMNINRENEREWRELFGSYDYVSQDGGGYNNLNTGNQGDVNNGAEIPRAEE